MKIREIFGECQPQFASKEDFPQTKFANKEGFPFFPMSTSTNSVLQICQQAKCLGGVAPPPLMAMPLSVR